MKLIIDIQDEDPAFAIRVLNNLTFSKKAEPMSETASGLWDELQEAAEEVRLHREGKIKLKTAQELLNEL